MYKKTSKKLSLLLVFALVLTNLFSFGLINTVQAEEVLADYLFISEYIEGGSFNKAIEIFNGTGMDVDLSEYTLELYSNGAATASQTLNLSGTIASGDVYVLAHTSATPEILAIADMKDSSVINFNGDDAVVLRNSSEIVDVFGKVGEDPGSFWGSGDYATADHTLVRKSNITAGDTIADDAFDPSIEWDSYPKDSYDTLGSHTMDGSGGTPDPVAVTGVTLDQETATVEVGSTLTLVATVEPADATNTNVTWSSSDDAIATVAGGTVTAVAEGIATITVTTEDGGWEDSCEVTVVPASQSPEVISIAEARTMDLDMIVTVEGVATADLGSNNYIQDETAGIIVRLTGLDMTLGDKYRVTAAVKDYYGMAQLEPAAAQDVVLVEAGVGVPEPQLVTSSSLGASSGESYEGELVKIENVTATEVDTFRNFRIQDSEGITVARPSDASWLEVGKEYTSITGVITYDYSEYKIYPRTIDDITGASQDPPPSSGVVSIAEARELESGTVTMVGIVTGLIGNNAFIQDDTAGIYLYSGSTSRSEFAVGNEIKITGQITEYNGLKEIDSITTVEVLSTDNLLPIVQELAIGEITEAVEGELVKITGVEIASVPTTEVSTNYSVTVTDGTNQIDLRVDKYLSPGISSSTFAVGDIISVTAPVGQYYDYQLMLRSVDDVDLGDDTTPPTITHTPVTEGNIAQELVINAQITDDRNVDSVNLYYRTIGETEYFSIPMTVGVDNYTAVIPSTELNIAGLQYYIEASDGTNTVTSPEDTNYPYEVTISSEDITPPEVTNLTPASGSTTGIDLRPEISASYSDESGIDVASVELYFDGMDVTNLATITETMIIYIPDTDLAEGNHTVRLVVSDMAATPQTAIVEWNFYAGERGYDFYFGQLHSHTGEISDGQGTLAEAYAWARDEGKADFFAVTDHSNWFDNENDTSNENITDVNQSTSDDWKKMNATADSYNVNGEYVAIAGFEMTWSGGTGGWGHINTFNTPWFASRSNSTMDLPAYYSHIAADTDSISQLNHPGTTFGDFADFGYYSEVADSVVHLIEVGNGEGLVGSAGYFPSYEYYTRALDKGWHVAPSNNQDNHLGNWITSNDARTVVLGTELTREGIFNAIRDLRVYSTEDKNLEIMYKVNDNIMGSTLNEPQSLSVYIDINDPDETDIIGKVSIIADGGTEVASQTFNDNQALWELELDPQYSYYYVRVDQADDEIAVTSPVWTSEVTPVGISKVEVSQDPQIVGEPINISATVYNNSSSDINDVLVEFYKDSLEGEKIGEATITSIEPGYSGEATIEWTSDSVGKYNIYAKTVINVGGGDKVFTGSTYVTFANPEDVTKVVLDMAHYNAYVSGDYAGKDLTLREMFKDRGYMLVENWDELTAEDLANTQLLIITDPQSTDNTIYNLEKSLFTDAEVAAIKDYTDNGGDLIICSRADYNDGVEEYSNGAQLNKILEAVGTNLRVNDDEVADYTNNGGQFYRLYFDRYVSTKYNLTDNIPEGNTYSFYSGCSVILKDEGSEEDVDWLVQGHETTGTIDSDDQNDNIPVEEGNVYAIGAEILPSGAKVVAAGTIFFSDFETASSDNMYSNKQITENILDWMIEAEEVELKTIAEVRADENNDGIPDFMGQRFAVEGRVTAQSEAVVPKNAFFEVIYVQDETGGITVFGVSTTPLPLGTKVRVTGTVDQYSGDTELSLENETNDITIIDSNLVLVEPIEMTTGDSMLEDNEGWLVKIEGIVTRMTDNSLFLDDGTGEARVYVNGYIGDGTDNPDMLGSWDPTIKVGDTVSSIGLASEDPDGHRLRVRNTGEIVKVEEWIEPLYPIEVVDVNVTDVFGSEGTIFNKGDMVIVNTTLKSVSRNDHSGVVIVELLDDHGTIYGTTMICEDLFMAGEDREYTLAFEMTGLKKGIHTARVYIVNNLIEREMISEEGTANFLVEFGN